LDVNKKYVFVTLIIVVIFGGLLINPNIFGGKDKDLQNDFWLEKDPILGIAELAAVIYSLNVSSEYVPIGTSVSISAKYLLDYNTPGDGYATISLKNEIGDVVQTKINFTKGLVTWNTSFFLDPHNWSPEQEGENATIELEVCATDSTGEQVEYKAVFFMVIRSNITIIDTSFEENITYGSIQEYNYTFLNSQNNSILITEHPFTWEISDSTNITKVVGSNVTDSAGVGNIVINTTILGVGNYTIKIYANQSDDYNYAEYIQRFNILNQSTHLECFLINQEVYVLTNYTSKNTTIKIEIAYYGEENNTLENFTVKWISSFSNGVVSCVNSGVILNITAPSVPGIYDITLSATKENYQAATKIVNINVLPRKLNVSLSKNRFVIGENFVNVTVNDGTSNCSVTNISLIFYYEITIENSDFQEKGFLNTYAGYFNLTIKIPLKYSIYDWATLRIIYNTTNDGIQIFEPYNFSFQITIDNQKINQININNGTELNITRGTYIVFILNLSSLEDIDENISIDIVYLNATILNVTICNFSAEEEVGPISSDTFELGVCSISIKIFAEDVLVKQIDVLISVFSQTALEVFVTISSD